MTEAIIVCGGRGFGKTEAECSYLNTKLLALLENSMFDMVITGGAKGADYLADLWAQKNEIKSVVIEAEWHLHGKAAGPIRNKLMLDYLLHNSTVGRVVAFPGGRGTANMIKQAKAAHQDIVDYRDMSAHLLGLEGFDDL